MVAGRPTSGARGRPTPEVILNDRTTLGRSGPLARCEVYRPTCAPRVPLTVRMSMPEISSSNTFASIAEQTAAYQAWAERLKAKPATAKADRKTIEMRRPDPRRDN
jgi:hypothetical protein